MKDLEELCFGLEMMGGFASSVKLREQLCEVRNLMDLQFFLLVRLIPAASHALLGTGYCQSLVCLPVFGAFLNLRMNAKAMASRTFAKARLSSRACFVWNSSFG